MIINYIIEFFLNRYLFISVLLFVCITGTAQQAEDYNKAVKRADMHFADKEYSKAKKYYNVALSLNPYDEYATNQIIKAEDSLVSLTIKEGQYLDIIDMADEMFRKYKFDNALDLYQKALIVMPNDGYAHGKISKLRDIQKNSNDKTTEFNQVMSDGVSLFDAKRFTEAIGCFKKARKILPGNDDPDIYIANTKTAKKQFDKKIAEYSMEIELANNLIENNEYHKALTHLEKAQKIFPESWAVANEIRRYQSLAKSEQNDSLVINNETQPELTASSGDTASTITQLPIYTLPPLTNSRDSLPVFEKLATIKSNYNLNSNNDREASNLENKIEEIELIMQQQALETKAMAVIIDSINKQQEIKKQLNNQYLSYIKQGDSLLVAKRFDLSISTFSQALSIKPNDSIASAKIELAKNKKAVHLKSIEIRKAYKKAIADADELTSKKEYNLSKLSYNKALELIPGEKYPVSRIEEINRIIKKIEAENTQKYNLTISKADNFYNSLSYNEAIIQYKIASGIKPHENYPKDKIAEINTIIEEAAQKVRNDYNLAIAKADKLYAVKIYDKAIDAYREANKIIPDKSYPIEMIDIIISIMEKNSIVELLTQPTTIKSDSTITLSFEPVDIKVRRNNYLFVNATNLSGNTFNVIISYGSDNGKNGGFVMQVPAGNNTNDFIIRAGNQYKWFADDNNWISIHPEKGDIEVSIIRISKSD